MKKFIASGLIISVLGFIPFWVYAESSSSISGKDAATINKSAKETNKHPVPINSAVKKEYLDSQKQNNEIINQNPSTVIPPKK